MSVIDSARRGASGLLFYSGMIFFGFVFILGPWVLPVFVPSLNQTLTGPAKTILLVFGVGLLLLGTLLSIFTRLYVKATASLAWVRTGMGGPKAVVDGGIVVVPFAHSITPVSMETMKLEVPRRGKEALITADKLRADVNGEFFIHIQKNTDDVLAAAKSLGEKCTDSDLVKALVMEKLVSALRTVAATKTLSDLNSKRKEFAQAVQEIVAEDLKHNGLTLESVTVSHLDQTPPDDMDGDRNTFDAEGLRTIEAIVQQNRVERANIKFSSERAIKAREVETAQQIYSLEVTQTKAQNETNVEKAHANSDAAAKTAKLQADAEAQAAIAKAEAEQKAKTFAANQSKMAGEAEATRDRAVKLAQVAAQQAVEVANQEREKAGQTAAVVKTQAVAVAEREREIAIQMAEQKRAQAEAERLKAEQAKAQAEQAVLTVEVTAEAEREKRKSIISKEAETEQEALQARNEANLEAYRRIKQAEGEQEAALKQAEAQIRMAEAEKEAALRRAEGRKAEEMVPVTVDREKVSVESARVNVLKSELEAKTANQAAAIELQKSLAEIQAQKEIMIALASAFGEALGSANMTIWGDPKTLADMQQSFMGGMRNGQFVKGLMTTTPPDVVDLATRAVDNLSSGVGGALRSLASRLVGRDVSDEEAASLLQDQRVQAVLAELKQRGNGSSVADKTIEPAARPQDPAPAAKKPKA